MSWCLLLNVAVFLVKRYILSQMFVQLSGVRYVLVRIASQFFLVFVAWSPNFRRFRVLPISLSYLVFGNLIELPSLIRAS